MAAAFGFSTGDFITSINLVKDIIKALNDSKGSSREYLEVINELHGLEVALIHVKAQYNDTVRIEQRSALRQAVEECETTIDKFLESLDKYHGHLGRLGSGNRLKDTVRKIQWHLCKADELTSFRIRICSHVQNIEMLLATIQASALTLSTRSVQAQEQEIRCQSGKLCGMADSVTVISQSFEDLKAICVKSGSLHEQALTAIESTKRLLIWQHLQTFNALQKIQDWLPPQILLQKPVMFLDALDRLAPIHLEWINSREAFLAVLKVRFKHHGHQMIENGLFALQATKTKQDVNLNRPWEFCLHPGQEYDMSMLFQDSSSPTATICTSCHYVCSGKSGEDIICENCHTTFRRVSEVHEEVVATYEEPDALFSGPSKLATERRKFQRAENNESADRIQDFRRVRLICKISNPWHSRPDNADRQEDVDYETMTDISSSIVPNSSQDRIPVNAPALGFPTKKSSISNAVVQDDDEDYTIKCICSYGGDDGSTVYCGKCDTWQHIICYYHEKRVQDVHFCADCDPRQLDVKRATEIQKRLNKRGVKRRQIHPPDGDAVLISHLAPNQPNIAREVGQRARRRGRKGHENLRIRPAAMYEMGSFPRTGPTDAVSKSISPAGFSTTTRLPESDFRRGWWKCCSCPTWNNTGLSTRRCYSCNHPGPCACCTVL